MPEDLSGFLEAVSRERECIELFVSLLENEKALLSKGQIDGLDPIIREKEAIASRLETCAGQRNRYLVDHGLSPDRTGMATWLAAHPDQVQAEAAWARTLALAAQAKNTNRLNGQLIQMHQQFTGQALDILTRRESPLSLYGPDGLTASPGDRQINDTV